MKAQTQDPDHMAADVKGRPSTPRPTWSPRICEMHYPSPVCTCPGGRSWSGFRLRGAGWGGLTLNRGGSHRLGLGRGRGTRRLSARGDLSPSTRRPPPPAKPGGPGFAWEGAVGGGGPPWGLGALSWGPREEEPGSVLPRCLQGATRPGSQQS